MDTDSTNFINPLVSTFPYTPYHGKLSYIRTVPDFPPGKCTDHRIKPAKPFADLRARQKLGPAIRRSSTIPDTVATSISDPAIMICR